MVSEQLAADTWLVEPVAPVVPATAEPASEPASEAAIPAAREQLEHPEVPISEGEAGDVALSRRMEPPGVPTGEGRANPGSNRLLSLRLEHGDVPNVNVLVALLIGKTAG